MHNSPDNDIIMIAQRLTTVRDCDMIFAGNGQLAAQGRYDDLSAQTKLSGACRERRPAIADNPKLDSQGCCRRDSVRRLKMWDGPTVDERMGSLRLHVYCFGFMMLTAQTDNSHKTVWSIQFVQRG